MPPLASEGIEQDRIEFWTNCSLPEITIRRQAFASLDAEVLWGASEGTFETLVKIALIGKSRYVCNLRNRIVRLTEHSGSSGKPDMIQIGDQRHAGHLFEIFHELRRAHSDQPRRRADRKFFRGMRIDVIKNFFQSQRALLLPEELPFQDFRGAEVRG